MRTVLKRKGCKLNWFLFLLFVFQIDMKMLVDHLEVRNRSCDFGLKRAFISICSSGLAFSSHSFLFASGFLFSIKHFLNPLRNIILTVLVNDFFENPFPSLVFLLLNSFEKIYFAVPGQRFSNKFVLIFGLLINRSWLGFWKQMRWNGVHAFLNLESESFQPLLSLSFLFSHKLFVQVLFDMLWYSFWRNGFHGFVLKSPFFVQLLFKFCLSDWNFVFFFFSISKTKWIRHCNIKLFALSEFLGGSDGGKLILFPLNGLLLDGLLELFFIARRGVIALWKLLFLLGSLFFFDPSNLSHKIGQINLILDFSGPASVCEKFNNFLNVHKRLCFIQESDQSLFNGFFLDISIRFRSHWKVSDLVKLRMLNQFLYKFFFRHKVLSQFLNRAESFFDSLNRLIPKNENIRWLILTRENQLGNKLVLFWSLKSVIMPQESIELFQIDLVRFCHWKLNLVQNSIECNELIDVDNLNDIFIKDSFLFSLLSDFSDQHFSLNFLLTHDIDASE